MHRRPVDNVDSGVRSQTYGLKKNCTAFSAVRGSFVAEFQIQTGAPARGSSYVSFVAQPAFIGPPHPRVGSPQGAAGILPKSNDERKRGEAFPQSRSVSQTKQSHLPGPLPLSRTLAFLRPPLQPALDCGLHPAPHFEQLRAAVSPQRSSPGSHEPRASMPRKKEVASVFALRHADRESNHRHLTAGRWTLSAHPIYDATWTVGRNVRIDYRWTGGHATRVRDLRVRVP